MIIFLFIFFSLIVILFLKIKLHIFIKVKNTESFIQIKSLWINFKRKGKFILKSKENINKQKSKENKNRKNKSKEKKNNKFLKWFFKNIRYDEIQIFEKVGSIDVFSTAIALPIVSLITTIPLNTLNVNYKKFNYKIVPDYNNIVFNFLLNTKASFRIIDLLKCIIREKMLKI